MLSQRLRRWPNIEPTLSVTPRYTERLHHPTNGVNLPRVRGRRGQTPTPDRAASLGLVSRALSDNVRGGRGDETRCKQPTGGRITLTVGYLRAFPAAASTPLWRSNSWGRTSAFQKCKLSSVVSNDTHLNIHRLSVRRPLH